ncbi:PREDICTED: peptidoglycan-recognition protein SC2-like [Branchiostoma belcheri]|uniref:Peptidoglycan-recognition protein n=1 Tax=Branchiostoma belcheri TaxID=7741 RepID=A0A6P5A3U6_BRABE|nr:PREDICTED: peptidoglycan-recognition protein SC2-like [Branchiostoma belcheri]
MDVEAEKLHTAERHKKRMTRYVLLGAVVSVLLVMGVVLVVYFVATTADGDSEITIISRAEWGARPPRSRANVTSPVPYVIIHHSYDFGCLNKSDCEEHVRLIQDFHMDSRGWDDIGYNFLVGGDGDVFEGRGWDVRGAHAGPDWNGRSIGICFMGNFTDTLPSEEAITAGKMLIQLSVQRNKLMANYTLYGHRQVLDARTCPGEEFYNLITEWEHWKPGNYTTT